MKLISLLYNLIRPIIGPRAICIYPISCGTYASYMMKLKPIYVAIPLIIIRLICCNPINGLFKYLLSRRHAS